MFDWHFVSLSTPPNKIIERATPLLEEHVLRKIKRKCRMGRTDKNRRNFWRVFFYPFPCIAFFPSSSCSPHAHTTHTMELQLIDAARKGRSDEVKSLLKHNPDLDVNWEDEEEGLRTALHRASSRGHAEVVKLLLAHPDINVNVLSQYGDTPFLFACENGQVAVVRLLLQDPRVDILLPDDAGCSPLWKASYFCRQEVVRWLIASGRDLGNLQLARKYSNFKVRPLLERFVVNSTQTRFEVRVRLGVFDGLAARLFALTVFHCDDLLQLKPAQTTLSLQDTAALRFFSIIMLLPMELQMILCHRVYGSEKQNILSEDSEAAFKALARILLSPPK